MISNFFRSILFYFFLSFSLPISAVLLNIFFLILFTFHALFGSKTRRKAHLNSTFFFAQKKWAKCLLGISSLTMRCSGAERLNKNERYLFLANHLSSFDIFTLLATSPVPIAFLSKPLYFKIPFLSTCMHYGGHISIDRKSPKKAFESIVAASHRLESGKNIVVFPEGTRSRNGQVGTFKTTPLSLLKHTQNIKLIPVTICGTDNIQKKNSLIIKKQKISLTYGSPIQQVGNKQHVMQNIEATIKKTYQKEKLKQ